jgi:hypothetical protein
MVAANSSTATSRVAKALDLRKRRVFLKIREDAAMSDMKDAVNQSGSASSAAIYRARRAESEKIRWLSAVAEIIRVE